MEEVQTKICRTCGSEKSISEFPFRSDGTHILDCKLCDLKIIHNRESIHPEKYVERRWKAIGIHLTYEEYLQMLQDQSGLCKLCGNTNLGGQALSVDHDHSTGKIRGLLCFKCNFIVGTIEKNLDKYTEIMVYLQG